MCAGSYSADAVEVDADSLDDDDEDVEEEEVSVVDAGGVEPDLPLSVL